jgi:hypothetical protein
MPLTALDRNLPATEAHMTRTLLSRRLGYSILCLTGIAFAAGCKDDENPIEPNNPSFTLALDPSTVTITAGGNATSTVTLTPTDFTGNIALTVEGAPTGLTAAFNPSPATTTSVLTITTVAALVPGTYNLTIRGTATGLTDRTAALTVNVVAAGTGTITLNFAACPAAERPVWLAAQDGSGPWTRVTGSNDAYQFTMVQSKGGVAFATVSDSSIVTVEYFTEGDLHQGTLDYVVRLDRCPVLNGESLSGIVTGLAAAEVASVSFGSARTSVTGNTTAQLSNAEDGTLDLVGFKSAANAPGTGSRMLLRRGINPANGGSVGTVDFAGSESFAPASATMTISNLGATENYKHAMHYYTAGGATNCEVGRLYVEVPATGSTFTAFGAPAANQVGTDWHAVSLFTYAGTNSFRTLHQYFQALGPQTLTLGSVLPVPTITSLAGAYKRLQAALTMPAEYQSRASLRYQDQGGTRPLVIVSATMAWFGSSSVSLSLPDFAGVSGWDNAWAPSSGASVFWTVIGDNATNPPHCAANAKYISAIQSGTL